MDGPSYQLRSLRGELRTLARQSAGQGEDWIASQLEEFHGRIERKYVNLQHDNAELKRQVALLKDENGRWNQRYIDHVLRHNQRVDYARMQIDRITQQQQQQQQCYRAAMLAPRAVPPPPDPACHPVYTSPNAPLPNAYAAAGRLQFDGGSNAHYAPQYPPMYDRPPDFPAHTPRQRSDPSRRDHPWHPVPRRSRSPALRRGGHVSSPSRCVDRPLRRAMSGPFVRPTATCRLCYASHSACDGHRKCLSCYRRGAACNYEVCRRGESCDDRVCTRLHPRQRNAWPPLASAQPLDAADVPPTSAHPKVQTADATRPGRRHGDVPAGFAPVPNGLGELLLPSAQQVAPPSPPQVPPHVPVHAKPSAE